MPPKSLLAGRSLACAFFFASAHPGIPADDEKWVGVAYYSPRPEYAPDAKRVFAILKEHHIRAVGTASASASPKTYAEGVKSSSPGLRDEGALPWVRITSAANPERVASNRVQ